MKIISLLSIVCNEYQELTLIDELNSLYNFDHNVFLLDSSADVNCFINARPWKVNVPQSVYIFSARDNVTETEMLTINSKYTLMIVVPENSTFENNLNLLHQMKDIRKVKERLEVNVKIGIFFPGFVSRDDHLKLFRWCKEHLIINIFAASYTHPNAPQESTPWRLLNIFTYHPFGTFDLINATDTYKNSFPSQNSNFRQHKLRVTKSLYSFDEAMWSTIFRLMNASYIEVNNKYTEPSEAFLNGIDVLGEMYAQEKLSDLYVYPLYMAPIVILVPEAAPYTEFSAYLQTVTSDHFFGYSLVTIVAVIILLSIFRYIKRKKILFFQSATDVISLLMNDNGTIDYRQLSCIEICLVVPLTFVGFVVVNGILSNLQSYLTRPVLQHQINTIDDIYRSPLHILTWDENWKNILVDTLTNRSIHENWSGKIVAMQEELYIEQIEMYNTSISFLTDLSYAQSLLSIQKSFSIKGFHNTQIEIASSIFSYFVNDRFLFFERLNEILHWIRNAGLYDFWWKVHENGKILKKSMEHSKILKPTDVTSFEFMMVVVYGWSASVIVFAFEIIWMKFIFVRIYDNNALQ